MYIVAQLLLKPKTGNNRQKRRVLKRFGKTVGVGAEVTQLFRLFIRPIIQTVSNVQVLMSITFLLICTFTTVDPLLFLAFFSETF